jgi:hypothetical protein
MGQELGRCSYNTRKTKIVGYKYCRSMHSEETLRYCGKQSGSRRRQKAGQAEASSPSRTNSTIGHKKEDQKE